MLYLCVIMVTTDNDSLLGHATFTVFTTNPQMKICHSSSRLSSLKLSLIIISRRALAREGDYEMMSVCACVCALVSHADFSKTATDFLLINCPSELSCP